MSGLRIAVDASFVDPGRVGGAEHMVSNLVGGLASACPPDDELVVYTDRPWPAPERVRFRALHGPGNRFTRITATLRGRLDEHDAVLFTNYFTAPFPKTRRRPTFVTVIHDLQYLHMPDNFSVRKRAWLRGSHEATLRFADRTVAISEHVRGDLLERYGRRWASRVVAIHNPISWERFERDGRLPEGIDGCPFVLAVAAQYPHKNLETLVLAFAELRRRGGHQDVKLVLAGQLGARLSGVAWTKSLDRPIEDGGLGDVVVETGYIDDATLGALYRHASVFAFPSLFEGFAMPPIEALGFGLPVLTTREASIPEVTMGSATYLDDPRDPIEIADRLSEMLGDADAARPTSADVTRIRDAYDPVRIGARYRDLMESGTS
ncbi:MAG: glycosyltransferase family 4 protein [Actinomycetota bacterium]|nr:glycosyltransferase family 4 protein [Actinomycetota bacterium]MDH5223580.1 glycosyltransferase family 4 protein [Actinomycetota bacterium]MDH5312956.1 glycosyltransferase family 4 protein [Actinomycetota bacterium]